MRNVLFIAVVALLVTSCPTPVDKLSISLTIGGQTSGTLDVDLYEDGSGFIPFRLAATAFIHDRATIYYTIDGTEPTTNSPNFLYASTRAPQFIEARFIRSRAPLRVRAFTQVDGVRAGLDVTIIPKNLRLTGDGEIRKNEEVFISGTFSMFPSDRTTTVQILENGTLTGHIDNDSLGTVSLTRIRTGQQDSNIVSDTGIPVLVGDRIEIRATSGSRYRVNGSNSYRAKVRLD